MLGDLDNTVYRNALSLRNRQSPTVSSEWHILRHTDRLNQLKREHWYQLMDQRTWGSDECCLRARMCIDSHRRYEVALVDVRTSSVTTRWFSKVTVNFVPRNFHFCFPSTTPIYSQNAAIGGTENRSVANSSKRRDGKQNLPRATIWRLTTRKFPIKLSQPISRAKPLLSAAAKQRYLDRLTKPAETAIDNRSLENVYRTRRWNGCSFSRDLGHYWTHPRW